MAVSSLDPAAPNSAHELTALACSGFSVPFPALNFQSVQTHNAYHIFN